MTLSYCNITGLNLASRISQKMKMFYITVSSDNDAKLISHDLLEQQLAACTNWFPINSMYRWEGEIKQGAEVVLIVKTKEDMRAKIEAVVAKYITYTNYIAEIEVHSINERYASWLKAELI